jgi:Zn-finger nucleic acid-binding protein
MKPTARQYTCPACGGLAGEQARSCPYCAAPIATARCAHCYHMNVPEAVHCSGCGRKLGLEPLGKPDSLSCPDCAVPFDAFCGGPGMLHDCPRCGGQFVEHELLRALIERREVYGELAPRPVRRSNPLSQPVRYIPCPSCNNMMNRKNFGGSSGIIVDECAKCGIWFDAGELPQVLAFVESGGLVRARRERENRQRTAARQAVPTLVPVGSSAVESSSGLLEELVGYLLGR